MAENEIEIEVILNAKGAEEGLDKLKEGGEAVGETFTGVGQTVSALGGEMNEKLGTIGESVGGAVESMMALKSVTEGSSVSFAGLLGPIGAVMVALVGVGKALGDYLEVNEKFEIRQKAYAASTSELTTAIEELASQQVNLTAAEVDELRVLSMRAKIPIETAQEIRDRNAARSEQVFKLNESIKALKKIQKGEGQNAHLQARLMELMRRRDKIQDTLNKRQAEAVRLTQMGMTDFAAFEALKLQHEKTGMTALKERAQTEEALLFDMMAAELKAQKQTEETKTRIAVVESEKRIDAIRRMEDVDLGLRQQMIEVEEKTLQHTVTEIQKAEEAKRQAEADKAMMKRKLRAAKRLAQERILQSELARIRRAEIENMRIMGADALDVLRQQEALALKLAGDNANARIAIEMEFANRRLTIQQEAEAKRLEDAKEAAERERELEDQRRSFMLESTEFDLNTQSDGIHKELALLDLKYQREMEVRDRSEDEITELTRRHNIERNRMIAENANQGFSALESTLDGMGESLQQSFGRSIFDSFTRVRLESKEAMADLSADFEKEKKRIEESGKGVAFINQQMTELQANYARERASIRKSEEGAGSRMVGELLLALGQQAAVESLMFSAKGTAALFTNPAAATGYFTASAIMGVAAVAAGASGSALSSSGGGGGGGSIAPDSTPTDSPTTAPSPERAQADSQAMVFNINFGNSTIYDTKRAAQDAMADQILRTINRQRRGAPRFAMG